MEKKKRILKSNQCPRCERRTLYHRSKTKDNVCIQCGFIFPDKENK